jgi:hypothetical protein
MSLEMKKQFEEYHEANPHIYEAFKKLALEAVKTKKHFSCRGIFHKLRWDSMIAGEEWGKKDGYKLLNATSPYYGRMFEKEFPRYKGFFRKKKILPEDFDYDPEDSALW